MRYFCLIKKSTLLTVIFQGRFYEFNVTFPVNFVITAQDILELHLYRHNLSK